MNSTYCKTCGAIDSAIETRDNACCGECGDTEGLVYQDDVTDAVWQILINGDQYET